MQFIYGRKRTGKFNHLFLKTNKLKEIVGASQLVDNICTKEFKKVFVKPLGHEIIPR